MTATPSSQIPSAYNPADVERRVYDEWLSNGYFSPELTRDAEPFTIIMPPPNVTGELHLGHALTAALEDILARWHRMLGQPTLWLPGKDHAGIATQWVVERLLATEGTNRHEIGNGLVPMATPSTNSISALARPATGPACVSPLTPTRLWQCGPLSLTFTTRA